MASPRSSTLFGSRTPLSATALPRGRTPLLVRAGTVESGDTVLVAGATGGVGQLLTAKLLDRGFKVRALTRSREKTAAVLGDAPGLEVVYGDMREASTLPAALQGVSAVACCTGTTAFPSKRWDGGNNPENTDYIAVKNLIDATPRGIQRFVLTTSAGVERSGSFPFIILNAFGVLKYKGMAENELRKSGLPYTIFRPGRLTDGPYTSYDLNTLLKGISGTRQAITMSLKDELNGETSRIAVAEAILQSLMLPETQGRAIALTSVEGEGPGEDSSKWKALFYNLIGAEAKA